jgi:hypothetical protein
MEPAWTPLTIEECHEKALECRSMAHRALKPEHRIMLEHMADTWDRICREMGKRQAY